MSFPFLVNRQRKHAIQLPQLRNFAALLSRRLRITNDQFVVLLTTDRTIRRYNRSFRNQDKATDVLSFPAGRSLPVPGFENPYLGDMMISVETAYRQALERDTTLDREIRVLMIHGLLHILGYDHESDQGQMRRKELKLQRELL